MVNAGRSVAGWLGGRLVLFLLALVVLVLAGVAHDRRSSLHGSFDALVPDAQLARDLQAQQRQMQQALQGAVSRSNAFLDDAHALPQSALAQRAETLDAEINQRKAARPSATEQAIALATGNDVGAMVENEAMIQLLTAERDQVMRLLDAMSRLGTDPYAARAAFDAADADFRQKLSRYRQLDSELTAFEGANPLARVPFELAGLRNESRELYLQRLEIRNQAVRDYNAAHQRREKSKKALASSQSRTITPAAKLALPDHPLLAQFDQLVAAKTARVEVAQRQLSELRDRARNYAWQAFWAVLVVSLMPLLLKAFWYYVMAPLAARRPPIQLLPAGAAAPRPARSAEADDSPRGISSVSKALTLAAGEELLVHPEFIQSLSHAGSKRTQWLLSRRLPFTSFASGMVALTRVSGAGATCTVASKQDPFAELAIIELAAGESLVLQPRSLAGIVQPSERPVQIVPRWTLGLGALITLQFRYLVFEGPARLIVAGCRGVRQEPASPGRSIDQNQTIGFSAHLAYAPRRSETFGAYLLGVNGLFNDSFAGGHGICVYEEMPYSGRRSGLTGRGLAGVSDLLLKFFGI
jgi:uncharacterized protein (AIM24 family)